MPNAIAVNAASFRSPRRRLLMSAPCELLITLCAPVLLAARDLISIACVLSNRRFTGKTDFPFRICNAWSRAVIGRDEPGALHSDSPLVLTRPAALLRPAAFMRQRLDAPGRIHTPAALLRPAHSCTSALMRRPP